MLLLVVEDGIKELKDELLLSAGEKLDLLELSLQLRSLILFAFRGVRLAAQEFGDRDRAAAARSIKSSTGFGKRDLISSRTTEALRHRKNPRVKRAILRFSNNCGLKTGMEYADPLLKPKKVSSYYNNQQVGAAAETIYGAGTTEATRFVKVRSQFDEARWKEAYSWFDGLGRTYKSQSVDSNGDVFNETLFDSVGRP